MNKRLDIDLDENPFIYIRIRSLFLDFFLAIILAVVPFIIILGTWSTIANNEAILENPDPIFELLLGFYFYLIWFALIFKRFRRVGINWNYLIGKVPNNFNWLPILFLAFIRLFFSIGASRVFYYPISLLVPNWLETILIDTNAIDAQNSFSPLAYNIVYYLFDLTFNPLSNILIFLIFLLYLLYCRYGKNKAILITYSLGCLLGYTNVIGSLVLVIVITTLYFKHRTLIVPLVFLIFSYIIYLVWDLLLNLLLFTDNTNLVANFQAQLPLGIFLVTISTPYLVHWLYKNRITKSDRLPYFVNKTEF